MDFLPQGGTSLSLRRAWRKSGPRPSQAQGRATPVERNATYSDAAHKRMLNITLGTAGHIDHGKTALVKSLTGCNTDRLKEEKERGMSIDLGYAPCRLPDLEVGIVDVPGHESFIKTMVAGACGMDGVILVVAADDGIMPQTREHLDILTLLGLRHGMVALTKIDRVDDARRQEVIADLAGFLQGTFLAAAPILPISDVTYDGFDPFLEGLENLVRSITPRRADGVFRMPLDRAFSAKGFGTVVAGIPVAGSASVGDEAVLLPQNVNSRIKRIEVYGQRSDTLLCGQCAAVNLGHSMPRRSAAATCSRCPVISRRRSSTSASCGSCPWRRSL